MDVVLHVCNFCMLTMFVLMNFEIYTVSAYVTMNFQPDIIRLKQDINITCTVHGVNIINSKITRQWSKGPNLICYNGHPIDSNKYKEILNSRNQFKLQIKNVSESDLNCSYQCRYGFEACTKNIQLSKNNFEYPPADQVRAVVHTNNSDQSFTINLHFKKIFPVPRCRALFGVSSLPFNITSSTNHGNFYKMNLRLKSIDKLQCDEEVVVKCRLITEYTIPTQGIRKCKIDENPFTELKVILCIPLLLLIVFFLIMYCKKKKQGNEWDITKCHKLGRPCIHESKSLIRMILTKSSLHLDQREAFLNRRKDMLEERDPMDDEDNRNSSLLTEKQENVSGDGQLQRGDAISFRRKIGLFKYEHHGIVEKIIPGTTRFRIIHVTGTSKDVVSSISSNLTTGICSEVIDFERDTDIYKYTFMCGRQDGKNPAAVAEMFLDYGFPEELGFHILHFNCESFSRYCATGVVYSKQTGHLNEAAQIKLDALVRKNCKTYV